MAKKQEWISVDIDRSLQMTWLSRFVQRKSLGCGVQESLSFIFSGPGSSVAQLAKSKFRWSISFFFICLISHANGPILLPH